MAVLTRNNIVTNGLVLYLDAANRQSYISGSTTWSDMSGNRNSGSLVNGATFDNINGGSIVFDGVNDFVQTTYTPLNSNYSISCTFNADTYSDVNRGIFSTFSASPQNFSGIYFGTMGTIYSATNTMWFWADGNSRRDIPYVFDTNKWYNVIFCITSNTILLYINSNYIQQFSNTTTHASVLGIGITRFNSNYWKGKISNFSIYNKVLSPTEILQNYNAIKTRFNLT